MLTLDMFALLAVFGTVSALDTSLTFHFINHPRIFRRNEVACQVCYGEFDCISMDKGRCGYRVEATAVLGEEKVKPVENEELKARVDSMMYDLLFDESIKEFRDCVPIISSYTRCNKDNICTGCKSCDCDNRGRWNCSMIQKCSRKPRIDHRALRLVMDSLKIEQKTTRSKRSNEAWEESATPSAFDDLAAWMYVSMPIQVKLVNNATTEVPTTSTLNALTMEGDNSNNLVFDDILYNDDLAHFIKSSEKDLDDMKVDNNDSKQFLEFLKNIEEGRDVIDTSDNIHLNLDLLKDLKEENLNEHESSKSTKDQPNSVNIIIPDAEDLDIVRQQLDGNPAAYALKRDARDVNDTTTTTKSSYKHDIENITQRREELQHIADIVSVLISNQRKELIHLHYVKNNLLKFIKKYKLNASNAEAIHKRNLSDNRNHNWKEDMLKFYTDNLNKDVKDVTRDIYAIEKLRKQGVVSKAERISNIKRLLLILSSYYLKNKKNNLQKVGFIPTHAVNNTNDSTLAVNVFPVNKTTNSDPKPKRRVFEPSSVNHYNVSRLKRALTRMILIIDNDGLSTTPINELSPSTRHIFNRIANRLYVDDNIAIRNPHFNLTVILSSMAEAWKKADVEIAQFRPADRLYNMKLLYFTMIRGIDKIKEALTLVKFGYSRRMNFIEEHIGKNVVNVAIDLLAKVDNRLRYSLEAKKTHKSGPKTIKDKQTKSVWHHIKNAFSKSTNGITKYVKGKFKPTSYIVNENAKKRVEEINRRKFLDVMKRWQETFNEFQTRNKRSIKRYEKRMKNIIPKYLRGKVKGVSPRMKNRDDKKKHQTKVESKAHYSTKRTISTTTIKYKKTTMPLQVRMTTKKL